MVIAFPCVIALEKIRFNIKEEMSEYIEDLKLVKSILRHREYWRKK